MHTLHIHHPAGGTMREFHRELEKMFNGMLTPRETAEALPTPMEIFENAEAYLVRVELPGLVESDLDVTFQDGTLSIRGEKKPAEDSREWTCHRRERRYGVVHRVATVPTPVAADSITAEMSQGVLTVTLPKREEAKPKSIKVKPREV